MARTGKKTIPELLRNHQMYIKIMKFHLNLFGNDSLTTNIPSDRNQPHDLLCKSSDWFLHEGKISRW